MINFNHLKEVDLTYLEHARFALGIGLKMLFSCVFFLIHGVVPFIQVPAILNLECMSEYMREKNEQRP